MGFLDSRLGFSICNSKTVADLDAGRPGGSPSGRPGVDQAVVRVVAWCVVRLVVH